MIPFNSYLSFWHVNKLKEFSAPRKLSSSKISTAVVQLGLQSLAICKRTFHVIKFYWYNKWMLYMLLANKLTPAHIKQFMVLI